MAETKGFEPSRRFPVCTLSRGVPSTTRPHLHICVYRVVLVRARGCTDLGALWAIIFGDVRFEEIAPVLAGCGGKTHAAISVSWQVLCHRRSCSGGRSCKSAPLVGLILCLFNAFDAILGRPIKPSCPVVARDISALLGLSGLDVRGGDTVLLNPYSELLADVFRAEACWE